MFWLLGFCSDASPGSLQRVPADEEMVRVGLHQSPKTASLFLVKEISRKVLDSACFGIRCTLVLCTGP